MIKKRVLIVASHPDDEVIGCAGTIVKHIRYGDDVHIVFMTDGVTARIYDPQANLTHAQELEQHASLVETRKKESLLACEIMGVNLSQVHHLMLADQRLDTYPLLALNKYIERFKAAIDPDLVYTHFWGDLNLDHRLTCEAVAVTFRPVYGVREIPIRCFEVPEATRLSIPLNNQAFVPEYVNNISDLIDIKIKAIEAYQSERRYFPHPRSPEALRATAKDRGGLGGFDYGEGFKYLVIRGEE